jgi:hypothetical protein
MLGSGIAWYDVVGLLGVGAILVAYALLQAGRWAARDLAYSVLNAVGAALVLCSLWFEFNLSAAVIEGFWLAISGYGIWQAWRARARDA